MTRTDGQSNKPIFIKRSDNSQSSVNAPNSGKSWEVSNTLSASELLDKTFKQITAPVSDKSQAYSISTAQVMREHRYTGLGFAQHLLIEANVTNTKGTKAHRTRVCHRQLRYGNQSLELKLSQSWEESAATMHGLFTCDNVWACPVCSARKAFDYGRQIVKALEWARDSKLTPTMITLTAIHRVSTSLEKFKELFKAAWQSFNGHRGVKRLRKKLGMSKRIIAREITRGDYRLGKDNGWHYHMHILEFAQNAILMTLDDDTQIHIISELQELWVHCLQLHGLSASLGIGLKVTAQDGTSEAYLAKMGLGELDTSDNLNHEMSNSQDKYNSLNQWSLLTRARNGDAFASELYVEFVETMTGDNWITWSPGLKDLVGVNDMTPEELDDAEEEIGNEKTKFVDFMSIDAPSYEPVAITRSYSELLHVAATTRSAAAVYAFLDQKAIDAGIILQSQLDDLAASAKQIHYDLVTNKANLKLSRNISDVVRQRKNVAYYEKLCKQLEAGLAVINRRRDAIAHRLGMLTPSMVISRKSISEEKSNE